MSDPFSATVLSAFLFVAHVGEGNGFPNTPDAAYVCGFDQTKYKIDRAGRIDVLLVPATDDRFQMRSVRIDDDHAGDYAKRAPEARGRFLHFYAANTKAQRIYFTVDVLDRATGQVIACDPEINNEDPP
jgi:hypothetical protein